MADLPAATRQKILSEVIYDNTYTRTDKDAAQVVVELEKLDFEAIQDAVLRSKLAVDVRIQLEALLSDLKAIAPGRHYELYSALEIKSGSLCILLVLLPNQNRCGVYLDMRRFYSKCEEQKRNERGEMVFFTCLCILVCLFAVMVIALIIFGKK